MKKLRIVVVVWNGIGTRHGNGQTAPIRGNHGMKSILLFIGLLLGFGSPIFAQDGTQPDHRFALRVNTLGVFNLDLIGDIEYSLSNRIGVFVGGGSEFVHPNFLRPKSWFTKEPGDYCQRTNWGVYMGMRISIPIGEFKGLALRPNLFYQRLNMEGSCWGTPPANGPGIASIKGSEFGLVMNLAYTQEFAKRFFVEPVVGFGCGMMTREVVPYGSGRYFTPYLPFQLNLGVRL